MIAAGSVAIAQVVGTHEQHIVELNPEIELPRLVGFLSTNAVSTATATAQISVNGWKDLIFEKVSGAISLKS